MHDPLVVAFELRRPWPQRSSLPETEGDKSVRWRVRRHNELPWWKPSSYSTHWRMAGRDYYWPSLITVWHREPGGRDSGEVCKHYRRWQDEAGEWQWKILHGWRWHAHHWKVQIHPLQAWRRRLLTRCEWCKGRHRHGDPVNMSHSWDSPRGRWWQGEPGLYHRDCSAIATAHRSCSCEDPITEYEGYGQCARCGRHRAFQATSERIARVRELQTIPTGARRATEETNR